jgi:hypothetical protein
MMGIQLAGDVLAGVGLVWMGESVIQGVRSWRPRITAIPIVAGLMAGAVLITLPGWVNRGAYAGSDSTSIGLQVESDQTDGASLDVLINDIKARGGGRTYAGLPGNWGQQYDIGQVPVYAYLADSDVDEFGFTLRTPSLLADNEAYFNQNDPAQYQLYNVRYILMPVGMTVPVPATLLATSGRHHLYQVATSGYLQVVDTSGIIEADRSDMAAQMQPFLRSAAFQQGELATIAFDGGTASAPTLPIGATPTTSAGTSADVLVVAQDGYFAGSVNASRTAAVVLKVTYDPLWQVRVDGGAATPYMVVPGFVAVTVGPGRHTVVFQYVAYSHYGALLGIGALTLLMLAFGPRLWQRRLRQLFPRRAMLLGRKTS